VRRAKGSPCESALAWDLVALKVVRELSALPPDAQLSKTGETRRAPNLEKQLARTISESEERRTEPQASSSLPRVPAAPQPQANKCEEYAIRSIEWNCAFGTFSDSRSAPFGMEDYGGLRSANQYCNDDHDHKQRKEKCGDSQKPQEIIVATHWACSLRVNDLG
jgi:hypothetical protein